MMPMRFLLTLFFIGFGSLKATPFLSSIPCAVQDGQRVDYVNAKMYSDKINYTKGGIICTFPPNYFDSAPKILVSYELKNLAYSSSLMVVPLVVENTAEYTKIILHKEIPGLIYNSVVEADTDDIIITVFAFED